MRPSPLGAPHLAAAIILLSSSAWSTRVHADGMPACKDLSQALGVYLSSPPPEVAAYLTAAETVSCELPPGRSCATDADCPVGKQLICAPPTTAGGARFCAPPPCPTGKCPVGQACTAGQCACTQDSGCPNGTLCTRGACVAARTASDVVQEFHADPTGQSDSTCAFRQAVTSAARGATVHIPRGLFRLDDPIMVPRAISLRGDGYYSVMREPSATLEEKSAWATGVADPRPLYGRPEGFGGSVLWARSPRGGLILLPTVGSVNVPLPMPGYGSTNLSDLMLVGVGASGSVGISFGRRAAFIEAHVEQLAQDLISRCTPPGGTPPPTNVAREAVYGPISTPFSIHTNRSAITNVMAAGFDVGLNLFWAEENVFTRMRFEGVHEGLRLTTATNNNVFYDTTIIGVDGKGIYTEDAMENVFRGGLIEDLRSLPGDPVGAVGAHLGNCVLGPPELDQPLHQERHGGGTVLDGFLFRHAGTPGRPNVSLYMYGSPFSTIRRARIDLPNQCVVVENRVSYPKFVDLSVASRKSLVFNRKDIWSGKPSGAKFEWPWKALDSFDDTGAPVMPVLTHDDRGRPLQLVTVPGVPHAVDQCPRDGAPP